MRFGIDLGGTKTELAALDAGGDIVYRRRLQTPAAGGADAIFEAIARLVCDAEAELGCTGTVGIATPGALAPASGKLRNSNTVCLNGTQPIDALSRRLDREIRIANDADCFALSEATDGAAAGARSVFGVILGTGVGGGLVWHGQLIAGPNAIAGEWGHNPLPAPTDDERPGARCYCGRDGCIETFLSGPGAAQQFAVQTGRVLPFDAIVAAAAAGDDEADAYLDCYEERLAKALAQVINIFDPEVVVLGGGVSNSDRLYANVSRKWGRYIFSDAIATKLVKNRHGDSSGVRGAAWLWPAADC